MQDRQLKEANKKRQEDIKNDTEKLFQLATELKAAVDKSNENLLSLDVIRKADEVEKLAKRVKEKMKQSIGPSPRLEPVPPGPIRGRQGSGAGRYINIHFSHLRKPCGTAASRLCVTNCMGCIWPELVWWNNG